MKIDPANVPNPGAITSGVAATETPRVEKKPSADSTTEPSAVGLSTDRVQLSHLLSSLRQAVSAAEEEITPERAAHLDKLSAQVASGEYRVDANVLSSKIVDDTMKGIG